jgi:phosphoribosylformimino-5-aminoimidazole carboxamide ribotide isomerase
MIVPSIDLQNGSAVQLVGGKEKMLDAGDPLPLARRFGIVPEIAVVDLDAALGRGSNAEVVLRLVRSARCRVGGGIRDAASARAWLDAGATSVVLGTAARAEVLREIPRERAIAALDALEGEVVVEGWRTRTGHTVEERMRELRELVGGFLVTFVEREGRLGGIDIERAAALAAVARPARLTVAGGVTSAAEIAALDRLGVDAQVGMALYTGRLDLAEALAAPLTSDRADGLWPTVIVDEHGAALGLAYSSLESLRAALDSRRGVYHSRTRGTWVKGATSGATQDLLRVDLDCDRDTLRFKVRQHGAGFCHEATATCWGEETGLHGLARRLAARARQAPPGSYTRRLLDDPPLLRAKLIEEATELAEATTREDVAAEGADVMYLTLVALARSGVPLAEIEAELDRRALRVTRRPGDAKPEKAS